MKARDYTRTYLATPRKFDDMMHRCFVVAFSGTGIDLCVATCVHTYIHTYIHAYILTYTHEIHIHVQILNSLFVSMASICVGHFL